MASDDKPIMEVQGFGKQKLILFKNKIVIQRSGVRQFFLHGLKGDKEIYLKNISGIQFKKAGTFHNGYIQFDFMGGQQGLGGLWEAVQNENSVVFSAAQQKDFEKIKDRMEKEIHK